MEENRETVVLSHIWLHTETMQCALTPARSPGTHSVLEVLQVILRVTVLVSSISKKPEG